ncbi:hypothetical protein GMAR_ORF70 [Golden Marseillevirus]|uniref:DNA topoisomerase II n=1 Tax=Golden Marseillevirus TaxID=1720526 RepID=UPI000877AEF9|nr:DNA topoisomerase II [Golden Marseillevirus]ALX27445.1 hypothetical protein GMAR_ORF70 [Golden Marseillevirus]
MIGKNKELEMLKAVLGLSKDLDKTLRYGKALLMCDADEDGKHIEGLVLSFFHKFYPQLLKNGFVVSLQTPILKAFPTKKKEIWFYSTKDFEDWISKNPAHKKMRVTYLKGLGSSRPEDGEKYLNEQKLIRYVSDGSEDFFFDLAFARNKSDERKKWLASPLPVCDQYEGEMQLSKFINEKLSSYHRANNRRSIPSVFDGLKPSQRKVLFACLTSGVVGEKNKEKVERLAGKVASVAGYHHGEVSLSGTIVGMAQNFVGSGNNIPLLFPDGSYGTRLQGGKDHAAVRYLHTYADPITRILFPAEDDELYERVVEDNEVNEPVNYLPILPLILVNGACGIGTGHSTEIPPHNPEEICEWINCWIDQKEEKPHLLPWWRGFKGKVEVEDGKGKTQGILERVSKYKWKIAETPIGLWTYDCKMHLDALEKEKHIKSFEDKYNAKDACFLVTTTKDFTPTLSNLKLSKAFSMKNMTALDENDVPVKFETVEDILEKYCKARLFLYSRRREKILKNISDEILKQANKQRFLEDVLSGEINMKDDEEVLLQKMEKMGYAKFQNSFEYLVGMPIRTLTKGRLEEVKQTLKKLKEKHQELTEKTDRQMWKEELVVFLKKYKKMFPKE